MQIDPSTIESTISSSLENGEEGSARNSKTKATFPMSNTEALQILAPYLMEYEKKELASGEYDIVYFFPIAERKKLPPGSDHTANSNSKLNNYGFDNENQEYNVKINEHIAYRYEINKKLGKGSFGIVLKCFDHLKKEYVALKVLRNKKRLYKQGLVEAKLIDHLNDHDPEDKKNIIRKTNQFVYRKHLCMTFEMLSINLYEFIKMNQF